METSTTPTVDPVADLLSTQTNEVAPPVAPPIEPDDEMKRRAKQALDRMEWVDALKSLVPGFGVKDEETEKVDQWAVASQYIVALLFKDEVKAYKAQADTTDDKGAKKTITVFEQVVATMAHNADRFAGIIAKRIANDLKAIAIVDNPAFSVADPNGAQNGRQFAMAYTGVTESKAELKQRLGKMARRAK